MNFLCSDKLKRLIDKKACNRAFVKYFCGENYSVIVSAKDLREILRRQAGDDVYSRFTKKKNCESQIKTFAEKKYREKYLYIVREKIRELTAEQAQENLEELIDKDMLFGIRVLKNS